MRTLTLIFAAALLSTTPALAGGHPDAYGCYENHWFDPFVIGRVCTYPANGDPSPESTVIGIHIHTPPVREPPHCPPPGEDSYPGADKSEGALDSRR